MVLACSDTYVKETAMFVVAGANLTCSFTIILISYIFIFSAILRIHSAEGRHKAFSTCGSHLTTVTIFYGTLFCMHLRPPSEASVEQGEIVAVFYTFTAMPIKEDSDKSSGFWRGDSFSIKEEHKNSDDHQNFKLKFFVWFP
ncbi:hypothetical protein CB1_002000003 [Camelus ferus]|nr:hypothetical protein CB1_002000003 [Camelus ferus]